MNANPSNPYVGPRTFNKEERDRFFGRDREARELLSLVASEQLVIFYAQSGAGKSSLVNTCLIPDLEKKGFQVLPVARVLGDAPLGMPVNNIFAFNLMRSLAPVDMAISAFASLTLADFSGQLKQMVAPASDAAPDVPSEGYVLIVDQFEEIFSTHNDQWESREDFFRQLTRVMRANPDLWVLLVMREDFIAALDPFAHLLHERGRIRYYMQRLERDAALKAITGPAEPLRPYEEGVAEKLFNDLCSIKVLGPDGKTLIDQPGQYVEPVQMQVVCYNLWENLGTGNTITSADLDKVGDVDSALGNYYAARVKGVAEARKVSERQIREWIEKRLIASGGIRNQVLQERVTPPGGLDDEVIQALQSDLIRSEKRGASTFYELTHDRLVEPILENNKLWFSEKLSPLQRQAALWVDKGQKDDWLSTGQALADIEAWAKQHPNDLSETDREFLEESRAYQRQLDERQQAQARELEMSRKFAEEQALANQRIRKALRTSTLIAAVATLFLGIAILLGIESFQNQRETQMRILMNASTEALAKKDNNLATLLAYQALINYGDEFGEAESALGNIVSLIQNDPEKVPYFVGDSQTGRITALTVSADGKWLAAGEAGGIITLWDLETLAERGALSIFGEVTSLALSPDGRTLAVVGTTSNINVWDVSVPSSPLQLTTLTGHLDKVTAIAFSPDGTRLASASWDQTVVLWDMVDPANASLVATLSGHTLGVSDVAFNPDGTWLASSSLDGTIILWDVNDVKMISQLISGDASIGGVAFNPNGMTLASGSDDGTIILWDLATMQSTLKYEGFASAVGDLVFSPDSSKLAVRGIYGFIDLLNTVDLSRQFPEWSFDYSDSLMFAPDGRLFLGNSSGIEVLDVGTSTLEPVGRLNKSDYGGITRVNSLSLLPNGKSLIVLGVDNTLQTIDLATQNSQPLDMSFSVLFDNTPRVVFSSNGRYVAVRDDNFVLTVRDLSANTDVGQWNLYGELGAVSSNGKYVVSYSYSAGVTVRDASTGDALSTVDQGGGDSNPSGVTLSLDGTYLASAGFDETILVWEALTGNILYRLPETRPVKYMAFSPDASRLAIAFNDDKKTVEVWDLATEQKILLIEDSDLKPLNYAVTGGFNFEAQEVSPSEAGLEDPALGNVAENLSNVVGLAYTEAGLMVLHQNGTLDRWTVWPSRSELKNYAQEKCALCELSYAQRRHYGLLTWHMWVHDYAGYFIFLLNLACYVVCARMGYRAIFSKAETQAIKQFSAWKAFWRASGQGSLLLAFSLLVSVIFTYIEVFKYPEGGRSDGFELLWLTLPLGLWAGGAYGHFTPGQSGNWSNTKRATLGALVGGVSGVFSMAMGLIAFLYAEAWRQPETVAELIRQSDSLNALLILYASGVVIASFTSLLGTWFYIFWLDPWSEGRTSPVADWFRNNHRLNSWLQTWWKRGLLVFGIDTVLGVVLLLIDYGDLSSFWVDDLIIVLIISAIVGVFGFLFYPQRSSYIWTVVLGVIGAFLWYPSLSSIPITIWLGVSSGFIVSAIFSRSWKRSLLIFIASAILLTMSLYLAYGTISTDSERIGIIVVAFIVAGFGRPFYPHKNSYIMMVVFSLIGIYPWYLYVTQLSLAVCLALGSGFILSAIVSGILHALKKI